MDIVKQLFKKNSLKKTTLALLEAMNFPFIKKIEKKGIN